MSARKTPAEVPVTAEPATQVVFHSLNLGHMAAMVDEKLLQYEASLYDATLDQQRRVLQLRAGLDFLRAERAAMTPETSEVSEPSTE